MKQLAIPLGNPKTVAKWLVISQQAGKSLLTRQAVEEWHDARYDYEVGSGWC
jgi:hypothetical protein